MLNKISTRTILTMAVIVIVFMSADAAKAQVVTDGLVGYWTFDKADTEGKTARAAWGDVDGTIKGDPEVVEGQVNEALSFDGQSDCIESDIPELHEELPAVSYEAWVKTSKVAYNHIISRGNSWKAGNVILYIEGDFRFTIFGYQAVSSSGVNPDGDWHHLVGIFDGSIKPPGNMLLYIDGSLEGQGSINLDEVQGLDEPLLIANRESSAGQWFQGDLDEVRIYDRALSEEEVNQNIQAEGTMFAVNANRRLSAVWGEIKFSR